MRGISSPANRLRFLNTLILGVSYSYVVNYASLTRVVLRLQTATGSWNGPVSVRNHGVAA